MVLGSIVSVPPLDSSVPVLVMTMVALMMELVPVESNKPSTVSSVCVPLGAKLSVALALINKALPNDTDNVLKIEPVILGKLMTMSWDGLGTAPVLQLVGSCQFPPEGLVKKTALVITGGGGGM
jgi:hypothetical protein